MCVEVMHKGVEDDPRHDASIDKNERLDFGTTLGKKWGLGLLFRGQKCSFLETETDVVSAGNASGGVGLVVY